MKPLWSSTDHNRFGMSEFDHAMKIIRDLPNDFGDLEDYQKYHLALENMKVKTKDFNFDLFGEKVSYLKQSIEVESGDKYPDINSFDAKLIGARGEQVILQDDDDGWVHEENIFNLRFKTLDADSNVST